MVYTNRKDLMVIELTEERNELSYNELVPLLMKRTSNVIYVELRGGALRDCYNGSNWPDLICRNTPSSNQ